MTRYRAIKVSNVEGFLADGVGDVGMKPVWKLHSVVPIITAPQEANPTNSIVLQWLVVLKAE